MKKAGGIDISVVKNVESVCGCTAAASSGRARQQRRAESRSSGLMKTASLRPLNQIICRLA